VVIRHVTTETIIKRWERWMKAEATIVAPALLYYEVTNGLYRYQRAGILPPEAVEKALVAALALPIELVSNTELHTRARNVAATYNLAATYDAHYLALAQWMEVDLWTADSRLVNSLKQHKLSWVRGIE
jgi:predicted nucleic acid-binding protein